MRVTETAETLDYIRVVRKPTRYAVLETRTITHILFFSPSIDLSVGV